MKSAVVRLFAVAMFTLFSTTTVFAGGPGMGMMTTDTSFYSNVSFNVSVKSMAKASYVAVTGDYSLDRLTDQKDGLKKLKEKFAEAKQQLSPYGKVTRNSQSIYAYTETDYQTGKLITYYNGYIGVRVDLTDATNVEEVQEIMLDLGFNTWIDAQLSEEDRIDLELEVADQLKSLIEKKKKVYQKILGITLKKSTGLYISSWIDGYLLDPETGMAPVTVSADITFANE